MTIRLRYTLYKSAQYWRRWIFGGLLFLGQQFASADETMHFLGRAFDLDSGRIVYTEEHSFTPSGIYRVIYREPSGEPFATKTADFSIARFAPDLEQHNERVGELIRIKRTNAATLNATYRENRDKSVASSKITATENTVIDAGFHPYIVAHWDDLLSGRKSHIDYIVPTWRRSVGLTIQAEPRAEAALQSFLIKPASSFMAMFADPVELSYDAQTRQLKEFRGLSNIAQRNGEFHRVRIVYEYPPSIAAND